jgi:hypothetical protein
MPFVKIPNAEVRGIYFELCDAFNAATDGHERTRINAEISGFMKLADHLWPGGTGLMFMEADLRLPDDGRPICAGMYLDV